MKQNTLITMQPTDGRFGESFGHLISTITHRVKDYIPMRTLVEQLHENADKATTLCSACVIEPELDVERPQWIIAHDTAYKLYHIRYAKNESGNRIQEAAECVFGDDEYRLFEEELALLITDLKLEFSEVEIVEDVYNNADEDLSVRFSVLPMVVDRKILIQVLEFAKPDPTEFVGGYRLTDMTEEYLRKEISGQVGVDLNEPLYDMTFIVIGARERATSQILIGCTEAGNGLVFWRVHREAGQSKHTCVRLLIEDKEVYQEIVDLVNTYIA